MAQTVGDLETGVNHVDHKGACRPEQLGAHGRHEPDGAGPDHRCHVAGLDLRPLGAEEPGGQDVPHEDGLLVGHPGWNVLHRVVGVGHDDVLGLAAAEAAEVLAVAERRLVDALVEPALSAQRAVPAGGEEARDHAVAGLEALDLRADLLDDADELVAEDRTLVHRRVAVKDVQVGTANGAEGDPDEGVVRALDGGLRDVGYPHLALGDVGQGPHGRQFRPRLS